MERNRNLGIPQVAARPAATVAAVAATCPTAAPDPPNGTVFRPLEFSISFTEGFLSAWSLRYVHVQRAELITAPERHHPVEVRPKWSFLSGVAYIHSLYGLSSLIFVVNSPVDAPATAARGCRLHLLTCGQYRAEAVKGRYAEFESEIHRGPGRFCSAHSRILRR